MLHGKKMGKGKKWENVKMEHLSVDIWHMAQPRRVQRELVVPHARSTQTHGLHHDVDEVQIKAQNEMNVIEKGAHHDLHDVEKGVHHAREEVEIPNHTKMEVSFLSFFKKSGGLKRSSVWFS
jgi:hypothetical protein